MAAKESFQQIIKGDTPVLVDFYAEWCGPCKAMAPMLVQFQKEMGTQVRVIKVDVDRNPEAAARFKVQAVPTLMLFKSGNIAWKHSGAVPVNTLKEAVKKVLS
jgi:thioredoxin 1